MNAFNQGCIYVSIISVVQMLSTYINDVSPNTLNVFDFFTKYDTFWYLTSKIELEIHPKSLENIFYKLAIKSPLHEYISKGIKIINLHLL